MTVLSSSYGIIMDRTMDEPGQRNNVVGGINAKDKHYLKEQMELIGKSESNDTPNIGMLPSSSKEVPIKFSDRCINILNNKERLDVLKGSTKMQNIESLFKYQSRIYNVQSNYDVNHRCMKMRCNNKLFP